MTGKPTPGRWVCESGDSTVVEERPNPLGRHLVIAQAALEDRSFEEQYANAELIAAAGTSADQLYKAGYDGPETLKALPDVMSALHHILDARGREETQDAYARAGALLSRLTRKDAPDDAAE